LALMATLQRLVADLSLLAVSPLAVSLLAAPTAAQDRPCIERGTVRVCSADEHAARRVAFIDRIVEMGVPEGRIRVDVDEWSAAAVTLRIVTSSGEHALRVALADLPPEADGFDVRVRTVAMVVHDHLAGVVEAPPVWTDERAAATDEDRAFYGFVPRPVLQARPGLWAMSLRGRGLAMLDRPGAALDGELSIEHVLTDLVTLGVEIAPAWFAVGDRITGGIGGGMTAAHLLFTAEDVLAVGVYAGVAATPRPGTPLAGILGLRVRLGLLDHAHAELRGSLAYNDGLGVSFGEARLELLLPASAAVEILVARGELAFELGWMGLEAGVRYWPTERREGGDFGVEIAVGARTHTFLQRCELGGCTPEWGAGGLTLSAAWLLRLR